MRQRLGRYGQLQPHIVNLILAQFFVQMVNASIFLILNFYMLDYGFKDYNIANFTSYRFLAVMLIAFPIGLLIKGKRLKPVFSTGMALIPFTSLLLIFAVSAQNPLLIKVGMICWGLSFSLIQASALPFVILNAKKETHSEAIVLFFLAFSVSIVIVGLINYGLKAVSPDFFTNQRLLIGFALMGFVSSFFALRIKTEEVVTDKVPILAAWRGYDWKLIGKAVVPRAMIAIGAGFTIPYINLFFENVHGIQTKDFSMMGAGAFLLVACAVILTPSIKRRFGYHIAINLFQSMGVLCLAMMAITDFFSAADWAVPVAVIFYLLRQPFMNMSGPMSSELVLYYVGEKNQELVSSLNASIWMGCWFFSSKLFEIMREADIRYGYILLLTASLYVIGIVLYFFLIKEYQNRKATPLTV